MVFYAQSTGTVISGRERQTDRQTETETDNRERKIDWRERDRN